MSFDRLAPHYRWLEPLLAGNVLERARNTHLPALAGARSVLLVGEGPGRCLAALLARHPHVRVTCLDASAAMLTATRERLARHSLDSTRVTFLHADLRVWTPPGASRHDAIITPFVLDCFGPASLRRIVATLATAANESAVWLVTDFAIPPSGWRRLRARLVHRLMYATFRLGTGLEAKRLTPPDAALREAGFSKEAVRSFNFGLVQSSLWRRAGKSDSSG